MGHHRPRLASVCALGYLTSVALLGACGSGDNDSAADAASGTIEVEMADFTYRGLPSEVVVGSQFVVTNSAPDELHEFVALRVDDDDERPVEEIVGNDLERYLAAGEPATVLLAAPGSDEQIPAVGDGTISEAGRYVVVCLIPTGADPAAYLEAAATSDGPPQVEGGPPHVANGMFAEFTAVDE